MKKCLIVCVLLAMAGCTDATYERIAALGNRHRVTLYSGGKQVATWTTTGRPRSVGEEDGWQFVDETSKSLIIVDGDVVIETLP